jgi:very-short-patch-repair endonuclease
MHKEILFEQKQPNLKSIDSLIATIPKRQLEESYKVVSRQLFYQNKMATIRTTAELFFANQIKRQIRLEVLPSVWIGRFCVDFFIPGVGGHVVNGRRQMKGLVIEINGPVHNFELKMNKDENRGEVLKRLGIGTLNIDNMDINSHAVRQLIAELKSIPRLNWRAKDRLKKRIYSWTILANNALYVGGRDE